MFHMRVTTALTSHTRTPSFLPIVSSTMWISSTVTHSSAAVTPTRPAKLEKDSENAIFCLVQDERCIVSMELAYMHAIKQAGATA